MSLIVIFLVLYQLITCYSRPVVTSASVSPETIYNGGEITITINCTSTSTPNVWNYQWYQSDGYQIYGGGNGVTYTDLGNNQYSGLPTYVLLYSL